MADSYTIAEKYILPSKGKIYQDVPQEVTIRSMTTEEEMRRLSQSGTEYKKLCDIIDKCIVGGLPISSYDMCLGDYQGLIYKLRTVTYGSKCTNTSICPFCGKINNHEMELDSFKPIDFDSFKPEDFEVVLPVSGKKIQLRFQTPRTLDNIEEAVSKIENKELDFSTLYTIAYSIASIDGIITDPLKAESFVRKLVMKDTATIMKAIIAINEKIGLDSTSEVKCNNPKCGRSYKTSFRISPEFFGPTI